MQNPLPRLKFLLTATNHHGVHSPFIYAYVTKCLYAKREYCLGKSHTILFKSVAYFGAKRIGLPGGSEDLQAKLQAEFPGVQADFPALETERPSLESGSPFRPTESPSLESGSPSRPTERPSHENGFSYRPTDPPSLESGFPSRPTEPPSHENGFPSRPTGPIHGQGHSGPYDILFAPPPQAKTILDRAFKENLIHNDTLLLVDAIYGNTSLLSLWKNITNDPKVTVTVNLFHCGAVFFRREQVREHFKIRI